MTHRHGTGDSARYQCTRCPDRLPLADLVDHLEAYTSGELRTQGVRT